MKHTDVILGISVALAVYVVLVISFGAPMWLAAAVGTAVGAALTFTPRRALPLRVRADYRRRR